MRVIGIDLGSKRIGVAVSDSGGVLATPYEVVARSGDEQRDHRRLLAIAEEVEAERIVIGLPLSLDGSMGPDRHRVRGRGRAAACHHRAPGRDLR